MEPDLSKALDSFLKAAELGSTLAMVEAGMLYWEMGKREEGIALYRKAAELGDLDGRSKLVNSYLQADPPNYQEAVKWLYRAAFDLYVRPQYQLALCVRPGSGLDPKILEAAARKCYMNAAKGGHVRPINKFSGDFSNGEGVVAFYLQARQWMMTAGDRGNGKAHFKHALTLFSEGETEKAMVHLELASEAGETAATHVKNVILQLFSVTSCDRANGSCG